MAEQAYLSAYFNEPADDIQRSRFFLMRYLLHVFAAALVLQNAARAGVTVSGDIAVPDYWPFHRGIVDRTITLTDAESKRDYGLVHCHRALELGRSERFREVVARLGRAR